jgi:hypothetical protein
VYVGAVLGTVMGGYDGHRSWVYTVARHPAQDDVHPRAGQHASERHGIETHPEPGGLLLQPPATGGKGRFGVAEKVNRPPAHASTSAAGESRVDRLLALAVTPC